MGKIRSWKPDFLYYEELVGIECVRRNDVYRLIEALYNKDLLTCPREIIGNIVVVPKRALRFLSLKDVKHKKVQLRYTMHLTKRVNQELNRRFLKGKEGTSYYTTDRGNRRTCCRFLVSLSVVKEIEKEI